MVDAIPVDLKLTITYSSGSFTYNDVKLGCNNDKIYELAQAMNSIQTKVADRIIKTEVSALSSF